MNGIEPKAIIIDEIEEAKKQRSRLAYLEAVERRMKHPLAVNLLTYCIRVGIATLLEKRDASA